jgi:heme A synthase
MLDILIYLAVIVIVVLVVWWLLQQLALPEPVHKIVNIALVVIVAVVIIGLLLHFAGSGPPLRLPR